MGQDTAARSGSAVYRIQVQGNLDDTWSDWFNGMAVSREGAIVTLTGPVADQSALLGLLLKIGYLNLVLVSVNRVRHSPKEGSDD